MWHSEAQMYKQNQLQEVAAHMRVRRAANAMTGQS